MDRINTSIGEVGIVIDGRTIKLRPSFYAMSKIADPKGIIEIVKSLQFFKSGMITKNTGGLMVECLHIIQSCLYNESDIKYLNKYASLDLSRSRKVMVSNLVEPKQIVILAYHLIKYGIIGKPKPVKSSKPKDKPKPMTSFTASEFVGAAMRELNLNQDEAWNLTMCELQEAMYRPNSNASSRLSKHDVKSLKDKTAHVRELLKKQRGG